MRVPLYVEPIVSRGVAWVLEQTADAARRAGFNLPRSRFLVHPIIEPIRREIGTQLQRIEAVAPEPSFPKFTSCRFSQTNNKPKGRRMGKASFYPVESPRRRIGTEQATSGRKEYPP